MSAITIQRPNPSRNYSKSYNIGEIHDALPQLKLRDVHLLSYLLSLPAKWTLRRDKIAKKLKMGVWTVGDSLRNLIKAGIASYKRFGDGKVTWTIKLPDEIITIIESDKKADKAAKAAATEPEPQSEYPKSESPALESHAVLETNNFLEINKETTNAPAVNCVQNFTSPVVASSENSENETAHANLNAVAVENKALPVVVAVDLPKEINVIAVKAKISLLAKAQQIMVLTAYLNFMAKGNVKNPIGVALNFCDKVTQGELFVAAVPENAEAIKQAKKIEQERKIRELVSRDKEKIIAILEAKHYVHFKGLGNFTYDALRPYLQ